MRPTEYINTDKGGYELFVLHNTEGSSNKLYVVLSNGVTHFRFNGKYGANLTYQGEHRSSADSQVRSKLLGGYRLLQAEEITRAIDYSIESVYDSLDLTVQSKTKDADPFDASVKKVGLMDLVGLKE
jgi:hypothetical protein